MDVITYLRNEHSKFRKMLASIQKVSDPKLKLRKFNILTKDLLKHETMEQKIFYPVLRKNKELRDILKHLLMEEKNAAKAIKSFKGLNVSLIWKLKFMKFKHDVDHHAKEEEQELFPKVRKYLDKKDLNALEIKMRKFKGKLTKKLSK